MRPISLVNLTPSIVNVFVTKSGGKGKPDQLQSVTLMPLGTKGHSTVSTSVTAQMEGLSARGVIRYSIPQEEPTPDKKDKE